MKSATINTGSLEVQLEKSLKQTKEAQQTVSIDLQLGTVLKQLWECHLTALCIFKLNPSSNQCTSIADRIVNEMGGLFENEIDVTKRTT